MDGADGSDDTEAYYAEDDEEGVFALWRDKTTKWRKKSPRIAKRRDPENVLTHLPAVIWPA